MENTIYLAQIFCVNSQMGLCGEVVTSEQTEPAEILHI